MNSKEYWQQRSLAVSLAAEREGAALVKELYQFYAETTRLIEADMEAFFGRYADKNGITLAEAKQRIDTPRLDAFHREMENYYTQAKRLGLGKEYESYLRRLSARGYVSRQEELLAKIRHQTELLSNRELEAFLGTLGSVYQHTFTRTLFDTQKGLGFGKDFNGLDSKTIESILRRPWLSDSFSDRIWKNKTALLEKLDRIIPQGFAMGQNSRVLGARLAKELGTARYTGERLARTEVNHAANEAAKAAYKECGVTQYEFLATLGSGTCDLCGALDGRVFALTDAAAGTNFPPMHPNCRCTTVPYFPPDEWDQPAQRAARDRDGNYYTVSAKTTFSDWKKQRESAILETEKAAFVPALTVAAETL